MQQLTIVGNLGADAQVVEKGGNKFVSFKVADTTKFTNQKVETTTTTTWISCALNGDGGNLLQYLKKGVKVCAIGRPSYRVYSSQKDRCMMAGVDLHVNSIELCGGSSDEVPRQVCSITGELFDVLKCYWVQIPEGQNIDVLMNPNGNGMYNVDPNGFLTPHVEEKAEQKEQKDGAKKKK